MGNRIYGCDDCLAVCPWNKFAAEAQAIRAFLPRAELAAPRLADLLALDDVGFRRLFSGSPIKRIGRDRFVRNCLYAAGNSGDAGLLAQVGSVYKNHVPAAVVCLAAGAVLPLVQSVMAIDLELRRRARRRRRGKSAPSSRMPLPIDKPHSPASGN